MKKILTTLLIAAFISAALIGCSTGNQAASQKSEEELKAEIKAEMEAEEKVKAELEEKIRAEMEAEQKAKEEVQEASPIALSALMTRDEIIEKLGEKYTFETFDDGGYFLYYSVLEYDGITFTYYHDNEKLSADKHPDSIHITSNKYTFNYDFKIGDPVLKAFEYCENNFKHAYNHHDDKDVFDSFMYKEKNSMGNLVDTGLIISWEYDTEERYESKAEIPEKAKIKSISIYSLLD